jgi:hypothetical protein
MGLLDIKDRADLEMKLGGLTLGDGGAAMLMAPAAI